MLTDLSEQQIQLILQMLNFKLDKIGWEFKLEKFGWQFDYKLEKVE